MNKTIDEIVSKSLDEINEIIDNSSDINKSIKPEEVAEESDTEKPTTEGAEEGEEGTDEGEEDTDTDGEGEEGTDEGTDEGEEDMEKSELEADLQKSENAASALEVSEFLSDLVKSIASVINNQRTDINKSIEGTNHQGELLAKSFSGLAKSQKAIIETQAELAKGLNKITERLDSLATQPMARKSKQSVQIVEKSFKSSLGNGKGGTKSDSLTKAEVLQKLTSEFTNGKPELFNDILAFESTGNFSVLSSQAKTTLGI